ncbi:MAG: FMN-binding glutamate synthase family protein [Pseudomonadota bacterium]
MVWLPEWIVSAMDLLVALFVLTVGLITLTIAIVFVADSTQTKDAILRNYPVVGHFRYAFSTLGEFFRQYFFAMDREELPFNRSEREWVKRASLNEDNTVAFGSTRSLKVPGTPIFVNCPFPTLERDASKTEPLLFGPYCETPYSSRSILNISGMSFGAISKPAILALSNGARMAGCWMNTGEGALSPHHLEGGADIVFQIGTAKYGVRTEDGRLCEDKLREVAAHPNVKMFEIKLSQGAKPGKGGILPGEKVTAEIAAVRGIPEGQDSISPNRHPEVDSVDDLLDFIDRVRRITGKPVGFKTVVGAYGWLENLCDAILARGVESAPDFITIDGGDGGTGAAPMPLMDNVGLTLSEAIPLVADILTRAGLKDRIRLISSGKLVTPSGVAWALCAGADAVVSARGFMFALGCIQALKCNKNTCPTGITTHNRRLQAGLDPEEKSVRVAQYCQNLVHEVEIIAHSCGVPEPRRLRRHHLRIVQDDGRSIPLDVLHPPSEAPRADA